ncbi:hypothetical protein SO802_008864 [Lithocarpus litseifolius]|uniref:Neprosin PEP catalytic domain-containing protein n=1 Tax=Lithocarpus litseifolius TaxID=425828 RepID=A0AAW2DAE6_9ROSI
MKIVEKTAMIQMRHLPGRSYTRVKGNIVVYNLNVKQGDSYAAIQIISGEERKTNAIITGWMVSPTLYSGAKYSIFFAHRTIDGSKTTGCLNLNCPAKIFNNFANPQIVGWGGIVAASNPPTGVSPPMGSGVFPDGKYEHSCSIRFAQYTNNLGIEDRPHGDSHEKIIDCPSRYIV